MSDFKIVTGIIGNTVLLISGFPRPKELAYLQFGFAIGSKGHLISNLPGMPTCFGPALGGV
jgi:hypothetical protein